MPVFYTDELDISVDEFLSACSPKEIQEVAKALIGGGYVTEPVECGRYSISEQEHRDACIKLLNSYHRLSNEDCDTIKNLSKKL